MPIHAPFFGSVLIGREGTSDVVGGRAAMDADHPALCGHRLQEVVRQASAARHGLQRVVAVDEMPADRARA